ncbi:ABC-2 type transporter, partial [mine drainage metagenome]
MKKNGSGYLEYISNPSDSYSIALGPVIQNVVLRITSGNSSSVQVLNVPISRNIPKPVDYYLPGLVGFTLANAIFAMVYLVPAYRKKKIFRQLEFSGLTKGEWLFSMVIFYFLLTMLSDLILFATGYVVFGIQLSVSALDVL